MSEKFLLSVGIDVGTSTTQIVFSRLKIFNKASPFQVPRFEIVSREILYRSPVYFTPLLDLENIDAQALAKIVDGEFAKAEISKGEIATGAVIITGESARKANAEAVAKSLSLAAGDFVVATAGADLEGIIAGKGAGTADISEKTGKLIANIDIGGGTSNFAVFSAGKVVDTASFDVGGRLIKFDAHKKIIYMSPKISQFVTAKKLNLSVGEVVDFQALDVVLDKLVAVLEMALNLRPSDEWYEIFTDNKSLDFEKLENLKNLAGVTISGGVGRIFYDNVLVDDFFYGDIGILLAKKLHKSIISANDKMKIYTPKETVGATVIGAGSHTMDISGSTISLKNVNLPMKNLPVLEVENQLIFDEKLLAADIKNKLNWYKEDGTLEAVAIAIKGEKSCTWQQLEVLACAILTGAKEIIYSGLPLVILLKFDMAKSLGNAILAASPKVLDSGLLVIDGITAHHGDYVDIGEEISGSGVVPVVVKTLIFS